jgi:hypothetical protein
LAVEDAFRSTVAPGGGSFTIGNRFTACAPDAAASDSVSAVSEVTANFFISFLLRLLFVCEIDRPLRFSRGGHTSLTRAEREMRLADKARGRTDIGKEIRAGGTSGEIVQRGAGALGAPSELERIALHRGRRASPTGSRAGFESPVRLTTLGPEHRDRGEIALCLTDEID